MPLHTNCSESAARRLIDDSILTLVMRHMCNPAVTPKQRLLFSHDVQYMIDNRRMLEHEAQHGAGIIICSKCGCATSINYTCAEKMVERDLCFGCNCWADRIKMRGTENGRPQLIVNRTLYTDGGNNPTERREFLGFGGTVFTIKQGDRVWTTNNLWCGGDVPFFFDNEFPDNAEF